MTKMEYLIHLSIEVRMHHYGYQTKDLLTPPRGESFGDASVGNLSIEGSEGGSERFSDMDDSGFDLSDISNVAESRLMIEDLDSDDLASDSDVSELDINDISANRVV